MRHGQTGKKMVTRRSTCRVSSQLFLAGVVATFLFAPTVSRAAPGDLIQTFPDPSASLSSNFGDTVAGVDGYVFVGASPLAGSGVVYMFDPGTGALVRTFPTPTPGYTNGGFGRTLIDYQGKLLVGAWQEPSGLNIFDIHTGARLDAYQNTGWLGISAAVDGAQILAGASHDPHGDGGAAYLFDGSNHTTLQTYTPPVHAVRFGEGVAFAGDHVVIGAIGYENIYEYAGAAFAFDRVTGTYLHTFLDPVPGLDRNFGNCVAAAGNDILIAGFNGYGVYLYDGSTFALKHEFLDPQMGIGFGRSMAVMGDYLLIGAPAAINYTAGSAGLHSGAAYLFDINTADLLHTYVDPTPDPYGGFGTSVAFVGGNVLIGECDSSTPRFSAVPGEAYLFEGPTTIPEPASLTLAAIGLGALALRRRRRG